VNLKRTFHRRTQARYALCAALLAIAGLFLSADVSANPTPPAEVRHASGIVLLPPVDLAAIQAEITRLGPSYEPLAVAASDARELAQDHQDLFGEPWMDLPNGQLVMPLARPEGEQIARQWMSAGYPRTSTLKPLPTLRPTQVPVRFVTARRSFAQLQSLLNESMPTRWYSGETRIWMGSVDAEHERVVLETDRIVDGVLYTLAKKYGTDAIAVRVDPRSGPFTSLAGSPDAAPAGIDPTFVAAASLAVTGVAVLLVFARRRRPTGHSPRSRSTDTSLVD
jgi:hypothetical protein